MALVLADRVLETTTTTGSGTITLAGAEPGYQSFSAVGDGNQTYYTIAGDTEWEVGVGTYTASGTTLSRDTVLSSSDSGSKVGFSAGIKKVFVTYPSEKSVNRDVSGNISASTGKIINLAEPTDSADAATKLYVDTLAAQGITYHTPVKYEVPNSTGNLVATYNNGTAGVSATLTNAGTLAAFVPDGVTATISDRILVYSQTNAFENGVYTVTVVGDGSTSWVLTRATDADTYALKSPNGLGAGDAFYVTSGNTGAGETYLCNTSGVITFGTTPINFVQISAAQVYSAGNGLSLTNTTFSLATPVAVSNGGTGTSATPTNGQLLIGNGSNYTLATLTAGSGVSITNSAGSITLSATGSGGTVTAVTATGPLASTGGTTPDISIANSTGTGSVVLDNGPIIYSATITGAVSASITTITGTSANITTVSGTNLSYASATITTGNLNFSGTGQRITGDMSNATLASRLLFQNSVTNGNTNVAAIPNGTSTISAFRGYGASDPTNAPSISTAQIGTTESRVSSEINGTASYTPMTFYTGGSERMRLDTSGNLGIGVTPSANTTSKLFNVGDFTRVGASGGYLFNLYYSITNARWEYAGTGTGAGWIDSGSGNYTFQSTGSTSGTAGAAATALAERMRIDSSGNVGIGTASPGSRLTLGVNATDTALSGTSNTAGLHMYARAFGVAQIDSIQSGSNNSGMSLRTYNNGTYTAFIENTQGNTTTFATAGSERMRIDSSGNVGIGTTSPSTALQVNGTITTTGLTVSNTITGSINGNAATVTDGMYLAATQTSGGRKTFSAAQSSGSLLTATGSLGGLETVATGANAAFMSFHRSGSYASYFGLDTDNQFAVGGWSAGAALANFKCLSIGVGGAASGSTGEVRAVTISASGTVSDLAGNVRNIPSAGTTKTSAYTLTVSDIGEFVTVGSSGSVTVPNSTFSAGNAITIYNDTTGNVSINISLTTCYVAGTNTNRSGVTLATRGVATILFISGTYGVISGNVT